MSSLQKRAWLTLWSMCPVYFLYFAIQFRLPPQLSTMLGRIACLAAVSGIHAVSYLIGLWAMKRQEAGELLLEDERDRAIDARATRAAYFVLLFGMLLVGVVMPFNRSGWQIVNAALLTVVLSETLRHTLILLGYKGPRLVH